MILEIKISRIRAAFSILTGLGLVWLINVGYSEEPSFEKQRKDMVEYQIKNRGIRDPKVLEAMLRVERHFFVSSEMKDKAYRDSPLPIAMGQTISQPYIVAYMTEALHPGPEDRVLEIGTGSGYQAAILAEIVKEVYSIEIVKELAEEASRRLQNLGYTNIFVKHGDGYKGWPEKAPFDAIIVTAAPPEIPEELVRELTSPGGRMIVPVGSFSSFGDFYQELVLVKKTGKGIEEDRLLPVRFVPMVNEN